MFLIGSILNDLCYLNDSSNSYPINTVIACLQAPKINQSVLQQVHKTLLNLTELFVFKEYSHYQKSEYNQFSINIEEQLNETISKYNESDTVAFDYFSDVSKTFHQLKDPHTLFYKSSYFGHFTQNFPLIFDFEDNFFSFAGFATNNSQKEYLEAFGKDISKLIGKKISRVNGLTPMDYFQYFADKYFYVSKSSQGRLNSFVRGDYFQLSLSRTNLLDSIDRQMFIQFMDGSNEQVNFYITTDLKILNSVEAQKLFEKDFQSTIEVDQVRKGFYEVDHKRPDLVIDKQQNSMVKLFDSEKYLSLYSRDEDLVLLIKSFSPDDMVVALKDTVSVLQEANKFKNKHKTAKLYISVMSNGGGWVTLGHALATAMFKDYPIYGKYSLRKSKLLELLFKGQSTFTDNYRFNYTSSETFTDSFLENASASGFNWYQQRGFDFQNASFTQEFGMADDQDPALKTALKNIYMFEGIKFNPNDVILLTDALCGSTCACFSKHLVQIKAVYAVGISSSLTLDKFDVASFAGGAVQDSNEYFASAKALLEGNQLSDVEKEALRQISFPLNVRFRFASMAIYSFNNTEIDWVSKPLEYKSIPVQYEINNFYPHVAHWYFEDGVDQVISKIQDLKISWFSSICKEEDNMIFRKFDDKCLFFSCSYGYYQSTDGKCIKRTDIFLAESQDPTHLAGVIVSSILLGIAGLFFIGLIVYGIIMYKRRDRQPYEVINEEEV